MNAAIEAAVRAFAQSRKDTLGGLPRMPTPDEAAVFTPHMTSAIIAFLRNCEVSEGILVALLPNVDEPNMALRELAASACMKLGVVDQNGIAAGAELARDLKSAFALIATELEGK